MGIVATRHYCLHVKALFDPSTLLKFAREAMEAIELDMRRDKVHLIAESFPTLADSLHVCVS